MAVHGYSDTKERTSFIGENRLVYRYEMNTSPLPELVLVEGIIEDEKMALKGISDSGVPCQVIVQRDGEKALDYLLDAPVSPTLVLLDYSLPKLSGIEVLTRLRQNDRTRLTPIVVFSGANTDSVLTECYRIGANSFVAKPSDPQEHIDRLIQIARYWLSLNLAADRRFEIHIPALA
jgi:two-component system, response regulator